MLGAFLLVALLAVPCGAHAATPADAIAHLNDQRAANGIPAGIAERADWDSNCQLHDHYMAANRELTHYEEPNSSYYTDGGAWAGARSVLASGTDWDHGNPFEDSPIHLDQLLAPRLAEMGEWEESGWVCATTWPGMTRARPAALAIYAYPGEGRTDVVPDENAYESPFVPGDFVGLPQGTTTGPHILVYVDGPWDSAQAQIESASLTGPDGVPLEIRWVDNTTGTVGAYLAPGGIVIPVLPLHHSTTYAASVVISINGQTVSKAWAFTTVANQLPGADFSWYPRSPVTGDELQLAADASDSDGRVTSVQWDFGANGTIDVSGELVTTSLPASGLLPVRLLVGDDDGGTTEVRHDISATERSRDSTDPTSPDRKVRTTRLSIRALRVRGHSVQVALRVPARRSVRCSLARRGQPARWYRCWPVTYYRRVSKGTYEFRARTRSESVGPRVIRIR